MTANNPVHILVVDDEEDICEILKFNLESEGYLVDAVTSAEEAMNKKLEKYNLFLLDVMMKGLSGFRLADEIRKRRKIQAPIFFITARNTENDKLTGFSVGADDFITKPFSIKEVLARVKAVLRRVEEVDDNSEEGIITLSGIELDLGKKRLTVGGIREDLTPIEFKILHLLMKNPGRIYSRDHFLGYVWQDANVTDRTVDVHITRLRKKLGTFSNCLVTRKGYGYCFEIE
jgi:two-component system, OmpR family, alkaline phosphatase synthesis response regulator PhoP